VCVCEREIARAQASSSTVVIRAFCRGIPVCEREREKEPERERGRENKRVNVFVVVCVKVCVCVRERDSEGTCIVINSSSRKL